MENHASNGPNVNERSSTSDLDVRLRTMQFIILAMAAGVVSFTAVAVGVRVTGMKDWDDPAVPFLGYFGVAFAVLVCVLSRVVPSIVVTNWRRRQATAVVREMAGASEGPASLTRALIDLFQTALIISAAFLEGGAFYQLVAYFVEGQPFSLGLALGLLVFLALRFPTRDGLERWMATQQRLLEQEMSARP